MTIATVRPDGSPRISGIDAVFEGGNLVSGRAIAARPIGAGADSELFHADLTEAVHTHLDDKATLLVVEWWTPTHGLRRVERE